MPHIIPYGVRLFAFLFCAQTALFNAENTLKMAKLAFLRFFLLEKRFRVRYIMEKTDSAPHGSASKPQLFHRTGFPSINTNRKVKHMKSTHLFLGCLAALSLAACQSSKDVIYEGVDLEPSGNPIFTDAWTCDPAPLVVGNRLYVYTGEDIYKDGENIGLPGNYNIADWRVYSTDDMVHWRSHGVKLRPEDFPDGKKGIAWAAQCIQKGDKFYWYVTYNTPQGGQCVGVAIGDTPVGPFVPHPKPLVVDSDTPGRGWNDIDPTVLIDDDGTAWLAWGQNSYIAKLKDNMTEIDGEITDLKLQRYIEGPWLYKRNGLYYNIYAGSGGRGGECINYSTAENPRGPWTFRGQVTGAAENSFTIHPGVVDYKGHTYLFYHNGKLDRDGQKGQSLRRSVCVDELFFNEDGTIKEVKQTKEAITEPLQ
jgi:hypothetical protein